jgi:hypothetical protein
MAVRDKNEVRGLAPEFGQVGGGLTADLLGVQTAVNKHSDIANLEKERICADATVAVQVDKIHERIRQREAQPPAVQA